MKPNLLVVASTAVFALATPTTAVQKRADYCGQWDNQVIGAYTIYNVCRSFKKNSKEC
jgi:xyloglucan-specific endo-beta-1,4-glucanase